MKYGKSNSILPTLVWSDIKSIVWLDYDGSISEDVLSDILTVSSNISPGSIFLISLNVQPVGIRSSGTSSLTPQLDRLKEQIGEIKIPSGISEKDLKAWGTASICRQIFDNEVQEVLAQRNGGLPRGSKILYNQLFNFHYADGAKMLTVGGLFSSEGDSAKFDSCRYQDLPYIRFGEDPFLIETPALTVNEISYLNKQLPSENADDLRAHGVPQKDIIKYSNVYRYFPAFTEIDA